MKLHKNLSKTQNKHITIHLGRQNKLSE